MDPGIYKHAPVFRIGGDEFAVILTGESYAQRDALLSDVYETFSMTYSDMARNPWERFSAAAGMAVYGRDGTNYEEVFNCADGRMYANKVEMKKRLS